MKYNNQVHPFHLVDPSPWPIVSATGAFAATFGGVMYFHSYQGGFLLFNLGLFITILGIFVWLVSVAQEEGTSKGQQTHQMHIVLQRNKIIGARFSSSFSSKKPNTSSENLSFFDKYKYTNFTKSVCSLLLGIFIIFISGLKLTNFITMFLFYLSFILCFIALPLLYKDGFGLAYRDVINGVLLFQLHFLLETYVSKYKGLRRLFYYSSMFFGMISFRVFDNTGILLGLFFLLYLNINILIFGSHDDSIIWNFFVKRLGYDRCVSIVGNLFTTLGIAVAKSLPKISKPMAKVAGGFLMADVVATKTGFYDYASSTFHDISYVQKRSMGIDVEFKPYDKKPIKSIIGSIINKE